MLSFRRIGAVSTKPAMIAAIAGATITHQSAVRSPIVQAASPEPASHPNTMNAVRPPADFARFQGRGAVRMCAPINVAMPSPAARMPQAAAAMSGRRGKQISSARTASG